MTAISAAQLRAGRGLIGWSQSDLAEASRIGRATIADFESGKRDPYSRTLEDLRAALEAAGVEFTNGEQPGVRLKVGYEPPRPDEPFSPYRGEPGIQTGAGQPRRPKSREGE